MSFADVNAVVSAGSVVFAGLALVLTVVLPLVLGLFDRRS